jgi:hypothetical protein
MCPTGSGRCPFRREPEYLPGNEGFIKLFEWPALGGMTFHLGKHQIFMGFDGRAPHCVDILSMSMNSRLFVLYPEAQRRFKEAVIRFHQTFQAKRTVMDFDLPDPADWQEVERIRSGVFEGVFEGKFALDLRG